MNTVLYYTAIIACACVVFLGACIVGSTIVGWFGVEWLTDVEEIDLKLNMIICLVTILTCNIVTRD